MQVAAVVWSGHSAGAETHTTEVASCLRRLGVDARVVFVTVGGPLVDRMEAMHVPYTVLGLSTGWHVLPRARMVADAVAAHGADAALLQASGMLAGALRLGGYRGRIVGVEHGGLLQLANLGGRARLTRRVDRLCGVWANDVEVAVSDCMLRCIKKHYHRDNVVRIYNGVDTSRFRPKPRESGDSRMVVGCAGRLIPGKGMETLVHAVSLLQDPDRVRVRIAGQGAHRGALEHAIRSRGLCDVVQLVGLVRDTPRFWQSCDVAAVPSTTCTESFGMVAVEAMATGLPVIASNRGGLPEIVIDGVTGALVDPGNAEGLAAELKRYIEDPDLRRQHGDAARRRAVTEFSLERTTSAYLEVLTGRTPSVASAS